MNLAVLAALALASPQTTWSVGGDLPPGFELKSDAHGQRRLQSRDLRTAETMQPRTTAQAIAPAGWIEIGPFGGDMEDVAASPNMPGVVLAGLAPSSGGGDLYRSTDGGASWTSTSFGRSVYDIEYGSGGTVYVGTIDGLWRSLDHGASWSQLPLGIGVNDQVFEVALSPHAAGTIWVGVANALGSQTQTLLESTDGGATWLNRAPLGGPYSFTGIEFHPTDPARIYAVYDLGFSGGGVFVSTDGGVSFVDRSLGIPSNPMRDVAHNGSTLYVAGGALFGSQFVGLWSSTNDGVSWTQLSTGAWPSLVIHDMELDPSTPGRILLASAGSGAFESLDGGATWSFGIGGTNGLSLNEVSLNSAAPSQVWLGASSSAVWQSQDGGATFANTAVGIGRLDVWSVAVNPLDADEVAIAFQGLNDGGVQSSTDGGANWTLESLPGTRWNTVEFDDNGSLYAISDGPTTIANEALYRRDMTGWTYLGPNQGPQFESELLALEFQGPSSPVVLMGGSDFGVAGSEPTIWRSLDLGATWTKTYEGAIAFQDVQALEFLGGPLAGPTATVVAAFTDLGSAQVGGVLRSTDGGASWGQVGAGLAAGVQGNDLAVAPDGLTLLLADRDFGAGNGGLYRSTDLGSNWTAASAAQGPTFRVEAHPNDAAVVFTSGTNAGPVVHASEDGGVTLTPFDGTLAPLTGRDLELADGGRTLYLATVMGTYKTDILVGQNVCITSPNSVGPGAIISAGGSLSVSGNDLTLESNGLPTNEFGLFFYGPNSIQFPFGNGQRCVGQGAIGVFRLPIVASDAQGSASYQMNLTTPPQPSGTILPGSTWYFQHWYRDPAGGGAFFNLSDALRLVFRP